MHSTRRTFLKYSGSSAAMRLLPAGGWFVPAAMSQSSTGTGSQPPLNEQVLALQSHFLSKAPTGLGLPLASDPPPSIAWAGPLTRSSPVATTLAGSNVIPVTSALVGRPAINQWLDDLPGNPVIGGFPCLRISRSYLCNGLPRSTTSPNILRIRTNAQTIEVAGVAPEGSFAALSLKVDGRTHAPVVLSSGWGLGGGWACGAAKITFASRGVRDIWIESGSLQVAYFKIAEADEFLPPAGAGEPQMTFVGDSYLQATSASFGTGYAIGLEVATRLGIGNVTADAIGGTGYINTGRGLGNLADRARSHALDGSQVYVVLSGLNDYGDVTASGQLRWPGAAEYETVVRNYFSTLRAECPSAVLVATAPFCPVPPMSDASYVANTATNPSGLGDFAYKADVIRRALQAVAGPWVYIDVLMGGGWLNSSGASGDVSHLQWFTGGTAGPGTSASYKPGNTVGGGGGGFGGIAQVPVLAGGRYSQAPEISATGGSGQGVLLASTLDQGGGLRSILIPCAGSGYTAGPGLPTIRIDSTFELQPATLGTPQLTTGINAAGEYPLTSFAPTGAQDLNNIYRYLSADAVHPSPLGVDYVSSRLARDIYDAVLAL